MAASWQKNLTFFFLLFFSPPQMMLHLQQQQVGVRTRPQEHRGVTPTPQWMQDISQVTPTHHRTLLCSLATGDPQMPQGYCWFHLLGGHLTLSGCWQRVQEFTTSNTTFHLEESRLTWTFNPKSSPSVSCFCSAFCPYLNLATAL